MEVTARAATDLLGLQANSAILFYRKIREIISYHLALEADKVFDDQIELDESYFGGHRRGKRGRGAAGKVAVLGLLKRQGKVFTVVVENTQFGKVLYRQIAGALAKRIVNYAKEGDQAIQGEDAGFIKFGSRVDIYLPLSAKIKVTLGQKVKGGIDIIAEV